jgi:hypothetical protein
MAYNFEDEIDEIRINLYEKYKNCSNAEFVDGINERARIVAEKYGITIVKRDRETYPRNKCAS